MPQTNKSAEQEQDQFCFQLGQVSVDKLEEGKKKRTFSGVAYSGEAITDHWYWDKVVFDLDSIQIKGRIPALLEHRTSQRAGAINSHSVSHEEGLKIEGNLLSNEFGTQVAQDSDDDFPWQMSVRIYPTTVEEVKEGSIIVNGRTFQAPVAVFRGGRIREVSFCALGADDNTSAVAASHSPKNFNQPEDTNVTELEQTKQALKQAEQDRDAARNELQQFKASKRTEDIEALAADLKTQFSAEDKAIYQNMDDATFAFTAKNMRQFSSKPSDQQQQQKQGLPSYLTQHQAGGDQDQQQFNGGGQDQHRFSVGIQKLQEMNKAGK